MRNLSELEQVYVVGWDKNLDYEVEKARLEELIKTTRNRTDKTFYALFLTDLENASRIGEAVEAFKKWAKDGKKYQRVRIEKRKDNDKRLIIIPKIVREYKQLRQEIKAMSERYNDFPDSASKQCMRLMGYNSHALRWCKISYWTRIGRPPQWIASVTGQKKLDTIMRYVQRKEGERGLMAEVE